MTYSRKIGSRTYYLSAYRESVTNAALSHGVARPGLFSGGDILPDLFSGQFDLQRRRLSERTGYTAR